MNLLKGSLFRNFSVEDSSKITKSIDTDESNLAAPDESSEIPLDGDVINDNSDYSDGNNILDNRN